MKESNRATPWIFLAVVAAASVVASSLAHGEFWPTKHLGEDILWFCSTPTAVIGLVLLPFPRARRASTRFLLLALGSFLCLPAMLLTWFPVFQIEQVTARRFVSSDLAPALERRKQIDGSYPRSLNWHQLGLSDPPHLLKVASYQATAREFVLEYRHPMNCGHLYVYRSSERRWSEHHEECWY